ncbi:MAG: ATP cone domain-containing protein, partial [Myxococcota bacterium]
MQHPEKIRKRTGIVVNFQPEKITLALRKATEAVRGKWDQEELQTLTHAVVSKVHTLFGGRLPDVEGVQDQVERTLMEDGYYDVARAYILYRERRRNERLQERQEVVTRIENHKLCVVKRDGSSEAFSIEKFSRFIRRAAQGYEGVVNVEQLVRQSLEGVYEAIPTTELTKLTTMITRAHIEEDPSYDIITTRLFLANLYKEVIREKYTPETLNERYRTAFVQNLRQAVELGRLSPKLLEMDLERLAQAIQPERDTLLRYRGIQTL